MPLVGEYWCRMVYNGWGELNKPLPFKIFFKNRVESRSRSLKIVYRNYALQKCIVKILRIFKILMN